MTRVVVLLALIFSSMAFGRVPDIEDLIGLEAIGEARISPGGEWIAYTVAAPDFDEDAYVSQIWLVDLTGNRFPLTRGAKSSTRPRWSPDGKWLSFVSSRHEDVAQIFAIRPGAGEAIRLTDAEAGVSNYTWSSDGARIAFIATEPEPDDSKSREEHMGAFHVVRREYEHRHLWTLDVTEALGEPSSGEQHTRGEDFSIRDLSFSPDGEKIAFSATINPDLIHRGTADIYVVTLSDNSIEKIVSQPGPDSSPLWSPDGSRIVFSTHMGREPFFALNNELAVVSAAGGEIHVLTEDFDEEPRLVEWNDEGIYFWAFQKTASHLFRINTSTPDIARVTEPEGLMASSFSLSRDGRVQRFRPWDQQAAVATGGDVAQPRLVQPLLMGRSGARSGCARASGETRARERKPVATVFGISLSSGARGCR